MATTKEEREEKRKADAKVREQKEGRIKKKVKGWAKGIPGRVKAFDERQKSEREASAKKGKAEAKRVKAARIAKLESQKSKKVAKKTTPKKPTTAKKTKKTSAKSSVADKRKAREAQVAKKKREREGSTRKFATGQWRSSGSSTVAKKKGETAPTKKVASTPSKSSKGNGFGAAFKKARKSYLGGKGPKNFEWKGKQYHTRWKDESSSEQLAKRKRKTGVEDYQQQIAKKWGGGKL